VRRLCHKSEKCAPCADVGVDWTVAILKGCPKRICGLPYGHITVGGLITHHCLARRFHPLFTNALVSSQVALQFFVRDCCIPTSTLCICDAHVAIFRAMKRVHLAPTLSTSSPTAYGGSSRPYSDIAEAASAGAPGTQIQASETVDRPSIRSNFEDASGARSYCADASWFRQGTSSCRAQH